MGYVFLDNSFQRQIPTLNSDFYFVSSSSFTLKPNAKGWNGTIQYSLNNSTWNTLSTSQITAGLINASRISLLRVLGLDAGEELLDSMFSRFCVGK